MQWHRPVSPHYTNWRLLMTVFHSACFICCTPSAASTRRHVPLRTIVLSAAPLLHHDAAKWQTTLQTCRSAHLHLLPSYQNIALERARAAQCTCAQTLRVQPTSSTNFNALTQNVVLIVDTPVRFTTITNGPVAVKVSWKLQSRSDRNPGFSTLKELPEVRTGMHSGIPEGIGSLNVPKYKYVPLVSVMLSVPLLHANHCSVKKGTTRIEKMLK